MRSLSFYIAKKYFFSRKKKSFINILSIIAMLAVAVGTFALVVVLSVFNGLEGLIRSLYGSFDADLKITLNEGKFFTYNAELESTIMAAEGIQSVTEVLEDNVLLRYNNGKSVVRMKGVSEAYEEAAELDQFIREGSFKLKEGEQNFALVGRGIRYDLNINIRNEMLALQFYYPKNLKPGVSSPSSLYQSGIIQAAGVFAIEKQYDEKYVFVPVSFARTLTSSKDNEVTSLEINLKEGASLPKVQEFLQKALTSKYQILNSEQQHASLLRAIKIEKLFVYLTFAFILAVASFTIFFSLSMLAIDKQRDLSVLFALGIPSQKIRNIFLFEGAIIALSGAFIGATMGLILCVLQANYGLISMGMATAVQDAYPVKILASDFIFTVVTIIVITLLASLKPANLALRAISIQRL